jgi:hypothetical protein
MSPADRTLFLQSVAGPLTTQSVHLRRRIEWHLGGNHVLCELTALLLSERCVDSGGPDSAQMAARLIEEVRGQLLTDGTHIERSPMYHAAVLWDICLAGVVAQSVGLAVDEFAGLAWSMAACLRRMLRPDGTYAHFNDSGEGIAPPARKVLAAVRTVFGGTREPPDVAESPFVVATSGYVHWAEPSRGDWLMADLCALTARETPGHYHDDGLSFELALGGELIVVNLGVHGYGADPYRSFVRSPSAHSTVDLGVGQGVPWGTFRVAGLPAVTDVDGGTLDGGGCWAEATIRPARAPHWSHRRRFTWGGPGDVALRIDDHVHGSAGALSYLHLAPGVEVHAGNRALDLTAARGLSFRVSFEGLTVQRVVRADTSGLGWYFPRYGEKVPTTTVVLSFSSPLGGGAASCMLFSRRS